MGIGKVGLGSSTVTFKRKNLFTFEIKSKVDSVCQFRISPFFIKSCSRPGISFEEHELNFLNDKMYYAGKQTIEPLTITLLDSTDKDTIQVFKWLSSFYDFSLNSSKKTSSKFSEYTADGKLTEWDGCGGEISSYKFDDLWIQGMSLGDHDMADSGISEIQLTLRYSQFDYNVGCNEQFGPCKQAGCD